MFYLLCNTSASRCDVFPVGDTKPGIGPRFHFRNELLLCCLNKFGRTPIRTMIKIGIIRSDGKKGQHRMTEVGECDRKDASQRRADEHSFHFSGGNQRAEFRLYPRLFLPRIP